MIHNVFNKDLLTQCKELYFKEQYIDLAPPPEIINKEEEYIINIINKYPKQDYHILEGQLKIIGRRF